MLRNIYRLRFVVVGLLIFIIIYLYKSSYVRSGSNVLFLQDKVYIWCTFSRVKDYDTPFKTKFRNFASSLKNNSDIPVSLNIVVDTQSQEIAKQILSDVFANSSLIDDVHKVEVFYHNINSIVMQLDQMINTMKPYFTPGNNTYYGNALFYISLGLHKIVPSHQKKIILLDVDIQFKAPISLLYQHFQKFASDTLFGLAKELSPVYFHILQKYRRKYPKSKLGLSTMDNGNQGYNSGVVLMDVEKLRHSSVYENVTKKSFVQYLSSKYSFVGHLGDQDFYTLLSFEYPELIYTLPCQWNRSLCQWWKYHGYMDIFDKYFYCPGDIYLYHGNCNTPIDQK
ncbi:xyloside xylosyltransferase 1 isoform X1 [Diaphorina citri]|uniref:Xyloside xylosyltransferase 1 isoform X1 n=1 Tax=Diaphorina citri TaxID=121845 RepID=A0A1S4E697_DIACI|nr:xyloside xylosyltransferase 1 isoform X1 [Diaphorina citri]